MFVSLSEEAEFSCVGSNMTHDTSNQIVFCTWVYIDHKSVKLRLAVVLSASWMEKVFSSPAVVGGLEGGVTQTCALLCLPCRTGRQRATTGTASSVTYRAMSSHATTAFGSTISNACRRSASPEMEDLTGSVLSAG